jgi:hypothetical protein
MTPSVLNVSTISFNLRLKEKRKAQLFTHILFEKGEVFILGSGK